MLYSKRKSVTNVGSGQHGCRTLSKPEMDFMGTVTVFSATSESVVPPKN